MAIPVTLWLAAFCGVLMVGLASWVSVLRFRNKIAFGDGGNPALMRAIRVHGNTAEHAPLFLLLVAAFELARGTTPFLIAAAAVFAFARLIFAAGLLGRGLHALRMAGAALTYALQFALAVGLALVAMRAG